MGDLFTFLVGIIFGLGIGVSGGIELGIRIERWQARRKKLK